MNIEDGDLVTLSSKNQVTKICNPGKSCKIQDQLDLSFSITLIKKADDTEGQVFMKPCITNFQLK